MNMWEVNIGAVSHLAGSWDTSDRDQLGLNPERGRTFNSPRRAGCNC